MAGIVGVPFPDPGVKPPVDFIEPVFPSPEPPVTPEPLPGPEPAPEPTPAPPVGAPPTQPRTPEALPEPFSLGGWLLVLGLIALAAALADLFNYATKLLWGHILPRRKAPQVTTDQLLQPLSNRLGTWEQGIDAYMGMSFTKLASLVGQTAAAIAGSEQSALNVAKALQQAKGQQANTATRAAGLATRLDGQRAEQARTAARVKQVAAESRAREHGLQGQIDNVTHHVKHVLEPELDALRARIPHLEKGATTAWDEIRKHETLLGLGAFTAATAAALSRLGGGWTRCETTQELGRALCRSNSNNWRKLLKGSLDVLGLVEMCASLRLIVRVSNSSIITDGLGFFSAGLSDLLKCTGATRPTPLELPDVTLAPRTARASLAPVNV